MQEKIKTVLKNVLVNRRDLFGDDLTFVSFKNEKDQYGEFEGVFSNITFGRIVYYADEKLRLSESLAIKSVREEAILEFYEITTIANEIFFYTKVLPFFNQHRSIIHLFPHYLYCCAESNCNSTTSIAVMENLKATGYIPVESTFLDLEHLKLMVKKLGEFHAYSYYIKTKDPHRFKCLGGSLGNNLNKFAFQCVGVVPQLLKSIAGKILKKDWYSSRLQNKDAFFELIRKLLLNGLENYGDPNLVICHGDYSHQNFMFKYENGVPIDGKFVDMGNSMLSNPALDLAWVLICSTNQKIRDEHWNDLIDTYYTALATTFSTSEVPAKELIIEVIPRKIIFGAFFAAFNELFRKALKETRAGEVEDKRMTMEKITEFSNRVDMEYREEIFEEVLGLNGFDKEITNN